MCVHGTRYYTRAVCCRRMRARGMIVNLLFARNYGRGRDILLGEAFVTFFVPNDTANL